MKSFARWTTPKGTAAKCTASKGATPTGTIPRCKVGGVAAAVILLCFALGMPGSRPTIGVVHADAQQSQPSSTVAAAGITLHSVSVDLPASDRMYPRGQDAEAINNNCLGCHSTGMVMTQPPLTRAAWQQEVEKMHTEFKAPVDASAEPAIVAYLVGHHGAK